MNQKLQDDLTTIKGIGPARQKWLGELFNVYTFEALGNLSAEEAERAVRAAGKILPEGEIAAWIAQAKALAAEKNSDSNSAVAAPDEAETPVVPTKSSWKPIASFVVEFQERAEGSGLQRRTKVHYMEADLEKTWSGIEREQLGLWIEQHVGQQIQLSASAINLTKESKPEITKLNTLKPAQVRIRQRSDYLSMLDVNQPERPFLGHVHHDEPITLEVDFEPDAEQTWQTQAAFNAQCEVQNMTTGQKTFYLDMKSDFSANRLTYKTNLSNMEPGMYRLAVLMRGQRPLGTTYFKLPKLNIL